jgi:predicted metal-dependent hydrolase
MNRTENKHIEGIGEVLFKRSNKTRFIRLKVDQKNGIVLTMPDGLSEQIAIRFVLEKKKWLTDSIERQKKIKELNTVFTENTDFKTRNHNLCLAKHAKNTIRSVVIDDKIIVWYPDHADVADPRIQRAIRKAVQEAWRIEAKKFLPERVKQLSDQFNFEFNSLTVKNAKTRWGSCSHSNNINLNLQLMRLPDHLIDYVILHELNHTVHKNHQKAYWKALENIIPDAKRLDKELNKYHLQYW